MIIDYDKLLIKSCKDNNKKLFDTLLTFIKVQEINHYEILIDVCGLSNNYYFEKLLQFGLNPNCKKKLDKYNFERFESFHSLLYEIEEIESLKILLKYGANIYEITYFPIYNENGYYNHGDGMQKSNFLEYNFYENEDVKELFKEHFVKDLTDIFDNFVPLDIIRTIAKMTY